MDNCTVTNKMLDWKFRGGGPVGRTLLIGEEKMRRDFLLLVSARGRRIL
jgi:hypothetical protein